MQIECIVEPLYFITSVTATNEYNLTNLDLPQNLLQLPERIPAYLH
jgi:hypothetical protein